MRRSWRTGFSAVGRGLAVLLLVLQAGADGTIAVAHATDPIGGPTAIESQHTASCVFLHDAARCVQCQHHTTRTLPAVRHRVLPTAALTHRAARADRGPLVADRLRPPTTQPRAPPSHLS
jgi:hypothetical protein